MSLQEPVEGSLAVLQLHRPLRATPVLAGDHEVALGHQLVQQRRLWRASRLTTTPGTAVDEEDHGAGRGAWLDVSNPFRDTYIAYSLIEA